MSVAIDLSNRRSPHYNDYAPELFAILRGRHDRLAGLTIELISWLRDRLGISTPMRLASEIGIGGKKAELPAALCQSMAADQYPSPPGLRDYLDQPTAFTTKSIKVSYHELAHPTYAQEFGDFLPDMSVIDLLFNVGQDSLSVIRGTHGERV